MIISFNLLGENSAKLVEKPVFKGDNLSLWESVDASASTGVETPDLFQCLFPSGVSGVAHINSTFQRFSPVLTGSTTTTIF